MAEVKRYSDWNVDELIYIDISKDNSYDLRRDDLRVTIKNELLDILRAVSKVCFMPLTFGGGIRTIEDIRKRLQTGADKVTINTIAIEDPAFIKESSRVFGSQCIVVSIDYKMINGTPKVFKEGTTETGHDLFEWVKEVEKLGAGEIFLNAIERDGMSCGYDIAVINEVSNTAKIPVIACGGAGTFVDFLELARDTNVSAIAAGNIFHFTELAYPKAKKILLEKGINVRRGLGE